MTERVRDCEFFECHQHATVRFIWERGTVYYCATHAAVAEANYRRLGYQPTREEGAWPWDEPVDPPPDTPLPEWCAGVDALLRELDAEDLPDA